METLVLLLSIALIAAIVVIVFMFNSCKHEWVHEDRIEVHIDSAELPGRFIYVSRCKHCGKIKNTRVSL